MNHRRNVFILLLVAMLLVGNMWLTEPRAQASDLSATRESPLLLTSESQLDLTAPANVLSDGPTEPVVVRLYVRDREHLSAVAGALDIWEVHYDLGYAVVAVSPDQYQWLQSLGYRLEIDTEKTTRLTTLAALDPRYYYYDNDYTNSNNRYIVSFLQAVSDTYPSLVQLFDIGDAWQASHGGHHRDLWVLRITNKDAAYGPVADKPAFFLMANTHAREVATPELAIRYIKYLTSGYNGEGGYGVDPDVTWLVNYSVVYISVMQNPDGHRVNEADAGAYRRKNMDNDDGCSDSSTWGVDLNRNHSFFWGGVGSSGAPCNETYHGPSRGSEPETQAFQDFFATVMRDQNGLNGDDEIPPAAPVTTTGILITLHSYSDLVLWPWGHTSTNAPNGTQLQTVGRKFAYFNGYTPQQSSQLYPTTGATDDWTYGKFGVASFTFEVGPDSGSCGDFFPAYGCVDGIDNMPRNFWAENKPAFLYAHKIARTPYMTAYGPDALDVTVVPGGVAAGEPVTLTATIDDTRYSGAESTQNISTAVYYVDTPPWVTSPTPVAHSMTASDGSFDEKTEDVQAAIDTAGLSVGRHIVYVGGQDANGNWGALSAAFLYILDPSTAPIIEGYVREAVTHTPLTANLKAGFFQTNANPATGYYHMMVLSDTYSLSAIAPGHVISTVTNIVAHDHQTIRQDFYLYPTCNVFADDVELGNQGWTASSPWAITTEASHSPAHSWTDSPGGQYSNSRDISLTSKTFNLSDYQDTTLSFWHIYDLETNWDFGYVEYSTDGGSTWAQVKSYTGYGHTTWAQEQIALPALDGQPNVRIRFRLYTDGWQVADGWHIDDIVLSAGGPDCVTVVLPPQLAIAKTPSSGRVEVGLPLSYMIIVSNTGGPATDVVISDTLPENTLFAWASDGGALTGGDMIWRGLHVQANDTLTVSYAVTLSCVTTGTQIINSAYQVTATEWTTPTVGQPVTITATSEGVTADFAFAAPVIRGYPVSFANASWNATSYVWDYGDGITSTLVGPGHVYTDTGLYTVTLTASNLCASGVHSQPLMVEDYAVMLDPMTANGQADPGQVVTYTLRLTNTGTLTDTFTLSVGSHTWNTALSTNTVSALGPNVSVPIEVYVTVPTEALAGVQDVVRIATISSGDPRTPKAMSTRFLTTTASPVYGVTIEPPTDGQAGAPGATVTYTLHVTNTGNAADTLNFTYTGNAWMVQLPVTQTTLAASLGADVIVRVTIPITATSGMSDTVQVTASGTSVSASGLLTTNAVLYQVFLPLVMRPLP